MVLKINKKNTQLAIILGIILFVITSGVISFGPQSIIGVSNIDVIGQGETIIVSMAVNQFDKIWFLNQNNVEQASGGSLEDVTKDVRIEFQPQGVFCNVGMQQDSVSNGVITINYFESSGSYSKDVLTYVKVDRANFASGIYDQMVGEIFFNACNQGQCDFSNPPRNSVTFETNDQGNITIENLGNLDNGPQCPDAGEVALFDNPFDQSNNLILIDKDDLEFTVRNSSNCLGGNLGACIETIVNLDAEFPDGHQECPQFTSCEEEFVELTSNFVSYKIPNGSGTALVTASMNKEFVGGVLFDPASVDPTITSVSLQPSSIELGETGTLSVNVRNDGDTGTVNITVFPTRGNANANPNQVSSTINSGETRETQFVVNATDSGEEIFNITAEGVGSGGGIDSTTFNFNITTQPNVCGNNVCELGEQITCPQDCETVPPEICGDGIDNDNDGLIDEDCQIDCPNGFVPQTRGEPLLLFGLIELPFFESETTTCVEVLPLTQVALIASATIIILALILTRRKKR